MVVFLIDQPRRFTEIYEFHMKEGQNGREI